VLENVFSTQRAVPLFEFRRLDGITSSGMEDLAKKVDEAVKDLHVKYASATKLRKRQTGRMRSPIRRRDNETSNCLSSAITSSTITSSPSLPKCTLQNEDPDQGINDRGCICGTITLPLVTLTDMADVDQSCGYTALPTPTVDTDVDLHRQLSSLYPCWWYRGQPFLYVYPRVHTHATPKANLYSLLVKQPCFNRQCEQEQGRG